MGKEILRKFIPVNKYDSEGIISWLKFMAAQGFILKKINNFFATFESSQFDKVEYLLLSHNNKKSSVLEITNELDKQSWHKVGQIGLGYTVYRLINSTKDNSELYNKARKISVLSIKKLIWSNIISPSLYLIVFSLLRLIFMEKSSKIPWLFLSSDIIGAKIFLSIIFIFLCIKSFINIYHIKKFAKSKNYDSVQNKNKWKKSMFFKIITNTICMIFIITTLGFYIFMECTDYKKTLNESPISSSVLKLSQIEEKNIFTSNHLIKDDYDIKNSIEYQNTMLNSAEYNISQYGNVVKTSNNKTERILHIKNIKSRMNLFSKLIFNKELEQKSKQFKNTLQNIDTKDKFQKLVYGKIDDSQYILGYKNKKITFVRYEGEEDLRQYIEDIFIMMTSI